MERIFWFGVVLVLADGLIYEPDESERIKKVTCSGPHEQNRSDMIDAARCPGPKDQLVRLALSESYLEVSPSSVWVKRCQGFCEFDNPGAECVPTTTSFEAVPVRIFNVKTKKENCALFNVKKHDICECVS